MIGTKLSSKIRGLAAAGVVVAALAAGVVQTAPAGAMVTSQSGTVGGVSRSLNDNMTCNSWADFGIYSVDSPDLNVGPNPSYRSYKQTVDVWSVLQVWSGGKWIDAPGVYERKAISFNAGATAAKFVRGSGFSVSPDTWYRVREAITWTVNGTKVGQKNVWYNQNETSVYADGQLLQSGLNPSACLLDS